MNKLYLHIGMGKTGSSAIQYFLYENKEVLKSENLCYPITENYFIDKDNDVTSGNGEEIINFIINEEYDKIFEYLEGLLEKSDVLISSEILLYYFGKNIDLLYDIVEQFNGVVILYIRKQDEYYNSLVNQWTKLKSLWDTDCLNAVHEAYFCVMKIINNINEGRLIVKAYEKEQFKNENIIDDFLECLGLELDDRYKQSSRKINSSLTPTMYIIKQEYNRQHKDVLNKEFINVLVEYSKQALNESRKNVFVISKAEREEVLGVYEAFNMNIAFRFLKRLDGKLFYNEINDEDVYINDESLCNKEELDKAIEYIKQNYKGDELDLDSIFNNIQM